MHILLALVVAAGALACLRRHGGPPVASPKPSAAPQPEPPVEEPESAVEVAVHAPEPPPPDLDREFAEKHFPALGNCSQCGSCNFAFVSVNMSRNSATWRCRECGRQTLIRQRQDTHDAATQPEPKT